MSPAGRPGPPGRTSSPPRAGPVHLGSLQRRLLLAALTFVTIALVVAAVSVGFILHRFVRSQLDSRLDSQIVALASDLRLGPDGSAVLGRNLDGPPFDRPLSGWYWQVGQGDAVLRSSSLAGHELVLPDGPSPHGDGNRPRPADGTGPAGEALILRIRTVPGSGRGPETTIAASAPAAALRGPLGEALWPLAASLAIVWLCLVGGAVVQVRLGLRPLDRLHRDLAEVRSGHRTRIPAMQPSEVRPLVEELNALLDQNEINLERSRTHVANLAHGLKTPLATLTMALSERGADPGGGLSRLVAAMDRSVRHHLRRARAAVIGGPARSRIDLAEHVEDLRAALSRIHADKAPGIEVSVPSGLTVACDPQDLDEMLGNLIENACQWCRTRVRIAAETTARGVLILIEDDGPGLGRDEADQVLRRGRRLDESVPGNGFGLSIAGELAGLYGGGLDLDRAAAGGLQVRLTLPS